MHKYMYDYLHKFEKPYLWVPLSLLFLSLLLSLYQCYIILSFYAQLLMCIWSYISSSTRAGFQRVQEGSAGQGINFPETVVQV